MAILTSVGSILFDVLMLSPGISGLPYIPDNPRGHLYALPPSSRKLAVGCFFLDFMQNARCPILSPSWICLSVWEHFFPRKLSEDMLRGSDFGSGRFTDP